MTVVPSMTANMARDSYGNATDLDDNHLFRIEPPSRSTYFWRKAAFAKRKRLGTRSRQCRMPVQIASAYPPSHMPSFAPTLEEESEATPDSQIRSETPSVSSPRKQTEPASQDYLEKTKPQPSVSTYPPIHFHRDSTSTAASDSTASSPTTTVSLTESASTETPITSPDTPASSYSLSSFTLANQLQSSEKTEVLRQPPAPRSLTRPSTAPKRPRNLKGLAVDTSSAAHFGRALCTASLPLQQRTQDQPMLSAPSSPTFVKPMKPPRRKGSNLALSIVTSGSSSSSSPPIQEVPPTPSLVRPHVLRHFPSSPALPLASPSGPPKGGMQLPPLATRRSVSVNFAEIPQERDEDEPNFDVPQSAGPKPQAYPDGPICIYEPHVYLFYEPPADVASQFGVVVNVASEVKTPFEEPVATVKPVESATMAVSEQTTPKASETPVLSTLTRPEYIHVPWDHNTDIGPDLYGLVKLIDERVQEGKRVLIHCQLGVSRSASLIVAYGLYKNPSMTVNEAYDAVKRRSKWISPNMSLIMQLQEFRTALIKQSAGMPQRGLSHRRQNSKIKIAPLGTARPAESPSRRSQDRDRKSNEEESGPKSAPLPPDDESIKRLSITTDRNAVTPGPSSAPSGVSWPTEPAAIPRSVDISPAPSSSLPTGSLSIPSLSRTTDSSMSVISTPSISSPHSQMSETPSPFSALGSPPQPAAFRDASKPSSRASPPHLKPLKLPLNHVSRFQNTNPGSGLAVSSPRSSEFAMNPAKPPTPDDTLGLTSPRVTTFQSPHTSLHPSPPAPSTLSQSPRLPSELKTPSGSPKAPQRQSPRIKPIMPPENHVGFAGRLIPDAYGHESRPSLDTLTSPRSSEFAMAGIGPPKALQNDDSFGLTSPRENLGFAQQMQLPHGRPRPTGLRVPSARERAFANLHSPSSSISQPVSQAHHLAVPEGNPDEAASDRRKLRSNLGMSTTSAFDLRSEYILAGKARELSLRPAPRTPDSRRESFHSALTTQDDMDALMSPRATEFMRNPFADALGFAIDEEVQSTVEAAERTTGEEQKDPRSPVQDPGSSPIVRNIADVFS